MEIAGSLSGSMLIAAAGMIGDYYSIFIYLFLFLGFSSQNMRKYFIILLKWIVIVTFKIGPTSFH